MNLVLTGYDDNLLSVGNLTSPIMEDYAEYHGFEFEVVRNFEACAHPSWQKLDLLLDRLNQYESILWLDADAVITNIHTDYRSLADGEDGLWVSRDWNDASMFSCGIMIWKPGPKATDLLLQAMTCTKWANQPLWDQSALQEVCCIGGCNILPRRSLNSVPSEVQNSLDPWQLGDFICHLTGISNDRRVELIRKYAP